MYLVLADGLRLIPIGRDGKGGIETVGIGGIFVEPVVVS